MRATSAPVRKLLFIFSHGFSVDGTESYRLFVQLAQVLTSQGYPCILFDYRGLGYSDLDFEEMTFDTECADLNAVIDFGLEKFPEHQVAIWGMSFGCAVAASVASQRSDLALLILWCLSAELYTRYQRSLGPAILTQGFTYTEKGFKVKLEFLESLRSQDTYGAIRDAAIPSLLVHGDADQVAPVLLAKTAQRLAPEHTTLHVIANGNHGFKSQPEAYQEALDVTLDWVHQRAMTMDSSA